jgi:membrane fusion protein (multidrug efflux system)
MQGLLDEHVVSRAEFDRAVADARQSDARAGEIRATIERKTVRAPFAGLLGIRRANRGQYLSAGDPLVSLESLDPIYVNFGVPQQAMASMRQGRPVQVTADEAATGFAGRITAVDAVVDAGTRNVQAQATVANPAGALRPGMFVHAEVTLGGPSRVVSLPASAISHAAFGDSVFVVGDLKDPNGKTYRGVRQQFVKVGVSRGDQISVLSGLKRGEEVVTSGVFKLRNGAAVLVNNKVLPSNSARPKPENS